MEFNTNKNSIKDFVEYIQFLLIEPEIKKTSSLCSLEYIA